MSLNFFDLYQPLAADSGVMGGVPYLLQPNFPLLLANTGFGCSDAALKGLPDHFEAIDAPPAFLLPERFDASELLALSYQPSATFEVCQSEPSVRSYWTEHVPWSEAWTIGKILTEAYGVPQWRFPFTQAIGKLLQKPDTNAFVAYLYGDAVGAMITYKGVGILSGVIPAKHGNGVGTGLIGRIHPMPFVRMAGLEPELPGQTQSRFIRYQQDKRP